MNHPLQNPVFNALCSGDQALSLGTATVKYFDEEVAPFAGFEQGNVHGFEELHALLQPGRKIVYADPAEIVLPHGWQLRHHIKGLQFIYDGDGTVKNESALIRALNKEHVDQMKALAILTKPGPFEKRTIEFGHYHGIFEGDKLVAMTGQRMHVQNYTEISAVCTHPDHTGKGYALSLLLHQTQLIMKQGQQPFLHVRSDNERAIALYKKNNFSISRPMNFYFMKRL